MAPQHRVLSLSPQHFLFCFTILFLYLSQNPLFCHLFKALYLQLHLVLLHYFHLFNVSYVFYVSSFFFPFYLFSPSSLYFRPYPYFPYFASFASFLFSPLSLFCLFCPFFSSPFNPIEPLPPLSHLLSQLFSLVSYKFFHLHYHPRITSPYDCCSLVRLFCCQQPLHLVFKKHLKTFCCGCPPLEEELLVLLQLFLLLSPPLPSPLNHQNRNLHLHKDQ